MEKAVHVNKIQCELTAKILSEVKFRTSFLQRPFLVNPLSDELKARMYFFAVGICHQTYQLANKEQNLFGWDYLEYGFLEIAYQKPDLFSPEFILSMSQNELVELIKPFFSPNHQPQNCTLDRLDERMQLWQNMADFLGKNGGLIQPLIQQSGGNVIWFYETLKSMEAFSDPLQKKTGFFIKLLEDSGLFCPKNPEELIPIMDYHMQRVLLRTGCVELPDETLKKKLRNHIELDTDQEIREKCIEAMQLIADGAGIPVLKMNDIFYMLGRSCCNENPLCDGGKCSKSPCSLSLTLELEEHIDCLLEPACKGANSFDYRSIFEPHVITHFY